MSMNVKFLKSTKDIIRNIDQLGLVLGYFDGLHIGHSQLISFAKSSTKNGSLGVLTFDRALKSVEGSLMTIDDKISEMEKLGVDYLFIIVCDDNLKMMSYKKFVTDVLKAFNPVTLFCGPDFKYGYGAEGDVNYLKQVFNQVCVFGYVKDHYGEKISSTSIKNYIKSGNIEEANRHLGRAYSINGAVVHGFHEGTKLGFPTANLLPETSYVLPPNGVYFTRTELDGKTYDSVTNIGFHPTINETNTVTIETHIISNEFGSLYGYPLKTYFYKKIRDEIKFDTIEELKDQMKQDVIDAKEFFAYRVKK